jgi:hypothetical protein
VKKECTVHGYNGFGLAVDEDGNLVNVSQGSRNQATHRLRVGDDGKVYLKAGKHPLAKKDTLIGIIGRPFRPHPLLQPQVEKRFRGHTPGGDPMSHAQTYQPGLRKMGDDPHPDRHSGYRCALWCEYPHEAYAALMDALYRPYVTFQSRELKPGVSSVSLDIHTPFLLRESQLFIKGEVKISSLFSSKESLKKPPVQIDVDPANQNYQDTLDKLKNGSNRYTFHFSDVSFFNCRLKVRLDLSGDHEVCLPCEPLFCGIDISTDTGGHRWIEFEKDFPEVLQC